VVIATSQIKNALGLDLQSTGNFILNWVAVADNILATHLPSLVIAAFTLATLIVIKRWRKKWPNMLIAMVVGSVATQALLLTSWSGVSQIALVGEIPSQLPPLSTPLMTWDLLRQLAPGAMALGLLGLVEAVSIARSVATRSGQQIHGNQEFIGQALSNILGSFSSSYATSGSFTRTGVNYEAGATSPLAALFAAVFLALIVLLFAPLAGYITLPSMAAILLMVAWNLIDWHHIKIIYRAGKNEAMVFSVTFAATLLLPMEFAIYLGVLLSLVLYLRRTSKPNITALASSRGAKKLVDVQRSDLPECEALKIIRIDGALFFGAVDYVQTALMAISQKHVLIVASGINFIDLAGTELLANEAKRLAAKGGGLYLCNLNGRVIKPIIRNGHLSTIGKRHIFATKALALSTIDAKLSDHSCAGCENR
jgi:SulP family sulfate permease